MPPIELKPDAAPCRCEVPSASTARSEHDELGGCGHDSLDHFQPIPWPVDISQHKIRLALKNNLAGCFGRMAFSDDAKLGVCKGVFDATPKKGKVVKNCQTNPIRQWDLRAKT
jgi:hypothetical protein